MDLEGLESIGLTGVLAGKCSNETESALTRFGTKRRMCLVNAWCPVAPEVLLYVSLKKPLPQHNPSFCTWGIKEDPWSEHW